MSRNPVLFIVGCPRSGTTMFKRMIEAHPQVAMVPEIGWLADRYERRTGLAPDGTLTPAFVDDLLARGALGRYAKLPLSASEIAALGWRSGGVHYAEAIRALFDAYAAGQRKPLAGNKTVDLVRSVATLHRLWPQAAIVHLVRDGRDVSASANAWRRAPKLAASFPGWTEDPVGTSAAWWAWQVALGREAGAGVRPGRYLEVRYERLVTDPAGELAQVCAAAGIPYDDAMPRYSEGRRGASAGEADAKHAWLPPTPGLRDWRTSMPLDDVARFEAVAGDVLSDCGYPLVTGPRGDPAVREQVVERALAGCVLPRTWTRTPDPHPAASNQR